MAGIDIPHETRTVLGRDGTRIVYVVAGSGPRDFVFCPGLGGPLVSYRKLFRHFAHQYRFISWEPRGLYRSGMPKAGETALRIEDHVSDLECIVEREGLERFTLGGWSMGVQLSLEYAHRHPERCSELVLINGVFGRILSTLPGGEWAGVPMLELLSRAGPLLGLGARGLLDREAVVALMHRVGFIAGNPEEFRTVVGEFKQLEFGRYLRMIVRLHEHTAEPYLEGLALPTLVTAGTRDWMAPPAVARELAARLPDAELFLIEGGTHYSLVEFPEVVHGAIERFLARPPGVRRPAAG